MANPASDSEASSSSSPASRLTAGGSLDILFDRGTAHGPVSLPTKSDTAQMLEALTCRLISRVTAHAFDHPDFVELLSDDYMAFRDYDENPRTKARTEYLAAYRDFVHEHPGYRLDVENIVADVNEENRTASVWVLLRVTGHPLSVQRESVTIVYWKWKSSRWIAYKQTGIRGAGGFL